MLQQKSVITLGDYTLVVEEYETLPTQIKNTTILAKIVKKLLAWSLESAMVSSRNLMRKLIREKETLIKLDAQYDSYIRSPYKSKGKTSK